MTPPAARVLTWESAGWASPWTSTNDDAGGEGSLPGVRPDEVDISGTGDVLTVKGEAKGEDETKDGNYHRRELRYGSFARSIALPTRVDHDKAEAKFENGILTISVCPRQRRSSRRASRSPPTGSSKASPRPKSSRSW
jgi:HSP20 family protein